MTKRRVLLLLTGTCERRGLPRALDAAFAHRVDVQFEFYGEHQSFTSESVPIASILQQVNPAERGPVDKLASALLDAGLERGCDLAIAVDDLELINAGRAREVRALFRAAVDREVAKFALTSVERERIAARCSFHLLAPMVEAYFFGERDAVQRALDHANAPAGIAWTTSSPSIETFRASDQTYADRVASPDLRKPERDGDKALAWRAANREAHPKHYMEFLCRHAPLGYREGKAGVAALEKLDFASVLAAPGGAPLLAELLADLEDGLGLPSVLGSGAPPRVPGVLRNL
jgi:hypothetical protein